MRALWVIVLSCLPSILADAGNFSHFVVGGDFAIVDFEFNIRMQGLLSYDTATGLWSEIGGGVPFVDQNGRRVGNEVAQIQDTPLGLLIRGYLTFSWNNTALNSSDSNFTVAINGIAIWTGQEWNNMHGGVQGYISQFLYTDTADSNTPPTPSQIFIYICGGFDGVGAGANQVAASMVAVWNPLNGWAALGEGINGFIPILSLGACFHIQNYTSNNARAISMALFDNKLYVGGEFTSAGGQAINHTAVWDIPSQTWSSLTPTNQFLSNGSDYCCFVQPIFPHHTAETNYRAYQARHARELLTRNNRGGVSSSSSSLSSDFFKTSLTKSSARAFAVAAAIAAESNDNCLEDDQPPPDATAFCCNTTFGDTKICCDVDATIGAYTMSFTRDNVLLVAGSFDMAGGVPTPNSFIRYDNSSGVGRWVPVDSPDGVLFYSPTPQILTTGPLGDFFAVFQSQLFVMVSDKNFNFTWQEIVNNGYSSSRYTQVGNFHQVSEFVNGTNLELFVAAIPRGYRESILHWNRANQSWEDTAFNSLWALGYVSDGYVPHFTFTSNNYGGQPYIPPIPPSSSSGAVPISSSSGSTSGSTSGSASGSSASAESGGTSGSSSAQDVDEGSSHNVGVIVGPVIAGIAVIGIVAFVMYRRNMCCLASEKRTDYTEIDDTNTTK